MSCRVAMDDVDRMRPSLVPTKSYSNSSTRAPGAPASRLIWSRATRRDVRRHTAQASELNLHSFRVHIDGRVTWRSLSLHRTSLHQICRRDRQLHTIPDCESALSIIVLHDLQHLWRTDAVSIHITSFLWNQTVESRNSNLACFPDAIMG